MRGFSYSTISNGHLIKSVAGTACSNGICASGSKDPTFVYAVVDQTAWWSLGSTPANSQHALGQSFRGYIPSDHPTRLSSVSYFQRPALCKVSEIITGVMIQHEI